MRAWNGWYHCSGTTYGTWLRGDPRGWRSRHHREHVDGDYKNPPPAGADAHLHRFSRLVMKRPAVHPNEEAQLAACLVMVQVLIHHLVEVVAVAIDDHHFHLLCRFPTSAVQGSPITPGALNRRDGNREFAIARHYVGIAKKESARYLSERSLVEPGGVWGKRSKCVPIESRRHQINVFHYIMAHGDRGAAVWSYKQPVPRLDLLRNLKREQLHPPKFSSAESLRPGVTSTLPKTMRLKPRASKNS